MALIGIHQSNAQPYCKHHDGTLDITFGNHGTVTTEFGSVFDGATGVAILPCGRIVAVGFTHEDPAGNFHYALAGYTPFGALDKNFGTGGTGMIITDLVGILDNAGYPGLTVPGDSGASAVALQKNCAPCAYNTCDNTCNNASCKIVVAGAIRATPTGLDRDFAVARYTCNGLLDTTFGFNNSGIVATRVSPLDNSANAVAIQDDGKIVAAGFATQLDGTQQFAVVRYNCDGSLDTEFGCARSGIVLIGFDTPKAQVKAVLIQKDGKIVLAGISGQPPTGDPIDDVSESSFTLARLHTDGTLDKCFGIGGKVRTSFSTVMEQLPISDDHATALVLLEDCNKCDNCQDTKIVTVGFSNVNNLNTYDFALAGYTDSGKLDNSFGEDGNGLVVTPVTSFSDDGAFSAILQKDCQGTCKIIAAGRSDQPESSTDFTLIRYHTNGTVDTSFGIGGIVITDIKEDGNTIQAIAQQPDGKIVAAGSAENGITDFPGDFALARYLICTPCCVTK